ncbi:MAG: hypothetical protein H7Z41_03825 [Cytophagales bacterium]|nr:hypothetical protein [Armatimonadota bacterium]
MSIKLALDLVTKDINAHYDVEGDDLVIIEEETIETPYGWVFFYTSRRYRETGDFRYALAGNGPAVFNRHTSSIDYLGTALPIDEELARYAQSLSHQ